MLKFPKKKKKMISVAKLSPPCKNSTLWLSVSFAFIYSRSEFLSQREENPKRNGAQRSISPLANKKQ